MTAVARVASRVQLTGVRLKDLAVKHEGDSPSKQLSAAIHRECVASKCDAEKIEVTCRYRFEAKAAEQKIATIAATYGLDYAVEGPDPIAPADAEHFPCQVLLLLDACHSGAAVKGLVSATDDASRKLTDEECGVTLISAAMGHERAQEKDKNGLFTHGLIKALNRTKGLPYNYRDGRQYVHHLFSFVFDEVKQLSNGEQHPFLSLPWTTESYAVRQVGKPEESE